MIVNSCFAVYPPRYRSRLLSAIAILVEEASPDTQVNGASALSSCPDRTWRSIPRSGQRLIRILSKWSLLLVSPTATKTRMRRAWLGSNSRVETKRPPIALQNSGKDEVNQTERGPEDLGRKVSETDAGREPIDPPAMRAARLSPPTERIDFSSLRL